MWEDDFESAEDFGEGSTRRLQFGTGHLYQVKMVMRNYEETPLNRSNITLVGTSVFWSAPVFVPRDSNG